MKKLLFIISIFISLASQAQIKISALPASAATSLDSLLYVVVDGAVTKKMYGYQLKALLFADKDNLSTDGTVIIDSLAPHDFRVRQDTSKYHTKGYYDLLYAVSAGEGVGMKYEFSLTAPTDTTVGWVDVNHDFLGSYPIRLRIGGQWSALDTLGGLYWDDIGKVFSHGRPYCMLISGQSNPGGSYLSSPELSPYNYYYGDTVPDPHVVGWNDSLGIWQVGHISARHTPWHYATGANYTMLIGKKFAKEYGRSVRVVMSIKGGTPLEYWSGSIPDGRPDTAAGFIAIKQRLDSANMHQVDLMIWGQGEGGITDPDPDDTLDYYFKLRQFYDSLRGKQLLTQKSIIISHGTGDPVYHDAAAIARGYGEGGLRLTQRDSDNRDGFVSAKGCESDGLHFTAKGQEELADRIYPAIKTFPLNPGDNLMGYKTIGSFTGTSDTVKLAGDGLQFVSGANGRPFTSFTVYPHYGDPASNLSGQHAAGLDFNNVTTNSVDLTHYNGTTKISLIDGGVQFPSEDAIFSNGYGVKLYSGKIICYDPGGANAMYFYTNAGSGIPDMFLTPGSLSINKGALAAHASAVLDLTSTTKGALLPRMKRRTKKRL